MVDQENEELLDIFKSRLLVNYLVIGEDGMCTNELVEDAPVWCKEALEERIALKKAGIKI